MKQRWSRFFEADLLNDFDRIASMVGRVDVVTLIDVIEHIPISEHPKLFANIERITRKNSRVILTYPSPQYQRYLAENNPAELQLIDETVDIENLVRLATVHDFSLRHYSLEDIWMQNQYVHVIFQRGAELKPVPEPQPGLLGTALGTGPA